MRRWVTPLPLCRPFRSPAACATAQSDVGAATAEVAEGARQFSENLESAARWYEKRDEAAADAITKISSALRSCYRPFQLRCVASRPRRRPCSPGPTTDAVRLL